MIHDMDEWPDYETLESQEEKIRAQEWDVLFVYDGCRWDTMREVLEASTRFDHADYTFSEYRTPTLGGTTMWTDETWRGDYDDVTYISGNPQSENVRNYDEFGIKLEEHVGEFIKGFNDNIFNGGAWDFAMGTSRPEALTNLAEDAVPPMVVHYLQPHIPFVGDVSFHLNRGTYESEAVNEVTENNAIPVFEMPKEGLVDVGVMRSAYYSNMEYAFNESKKLIDRLREHYNVVLTADHGSAVGPDSYGHGGPRDARKRVVPWVEL